MFVRKPLLVRLLWVLIVLLSLLAVGVSYVRLNLSPSLPDGLDRLHAVASPLTREMLVVVDVPGWSARTVPFLKPVAAGTWVCRVGQTLATDHRDSGPLYEAWRGNPLPAAIAAETCVGVLPGHVLLATATPASLDSRYDGPVAVAQMAAIATPLVTWGTADAAPNHRSFR